MADWDHDGLPDLIVNSILGKVVWYRNIGTRRAPKLGRSPWKWNGATPALAQVGLDGPKAKALPNGVLRRWCGLGRDD